MAERATPPATRFAVQRHETPDSAESHFDLLVERDGVLVTFRVDDLDALAELAEGERLAVERIADHRIIYLDFEGSISGDRGTVTLRDRGPGEVRPRGDGSLDLRVAGDRVRGTFRAAPAAPEAEAAPLGPWVLERVPDPPA